MDTREQSTATEPRWQPLDRIERRVLGVLIEKSKTTPGQYPMTLNAITTGCNQKSNRKPQMNLSSDDVQLALDNLREVGAVIEVLGDGRVAKYKHLGYKWLGVDKAELAVMAELLLRGEQTLGDLRARVARMHPLKSQSELMPIVRSLIDKNLVIELTPPGRGQIVTHNLYLPEQLQKIRREIGTGPISSIQENQPAVRESMTSGDVSPNIAEPSRSAALENRIERLEDQVAQLLTRLELIEQQLD